MERYNLGRVTGLSAYELAVKNGFKGTESEWIDTLKGSKGDSAYEIWLEQGNTGTEEDFLESLKGKDAPTKTDWYQSYQAPLIVNSVEEFPNAVTGSKCIVRTSKNTGTIKKYNQTSGEVTESKWVTVEGKNAHTMTTDKTTVKTDGATVLEYSLNTNRGTEYECTITDGDPWSITNYETADEWTIGKTAAGQDLASSVLSPYIAVDLSNAESGKYRMQFSGNKKDDLTANDTACRIAFYDENKALLGTKYIKWATDSGKTDKLVASDSHVGVHISEDGNSYYLYVGTCDVDDDLVSYYSSIKYVQFSYSASAINETYSLTVTLLDELEEIASYQEIGTYNVTDNLTNADISKNWVLVSDGLEYEYTTIIISDKNGWSNVGTVYIANTTDDFNIELSEKWVLATNNYYYEYRRGIPSASETTLGGIKIWTTVEEGITILNISTEEV